MKIFNKYNYGNVEGIKDELQKLSFSELNALMEMCIKFAKGRYHKDYKKYYSLVIEEIRKHIDDRIQNKLFKHK